AGRYSWRMLVYAGLDEAGYGPPLGPLTVACAAFSMANHDGPKLPSLWSVLRGAVAKEIKSAKGRVLVNDSKRLKGANSGASHPLRHLERGVLAFLATGPDPIRPGTDLELYERVAPGLLRAIEQVPWYRGEPIALPVAHEAAEIGIAANSLSRAMERTGVELRVLHCLAMAEPEFNETVARVRSKAAASFLLFGRHLAAISRSMGAEHPKVVVDRQGGRCYYRDQLQTLFPEAFIRILLETPQVCHYQLSEGDRAMTISFAEEADAEHLPVALASMLAKYVRELMMMR